MVVRLECKQGGMLFGAERVYDEATPEEAHCDTNRDLNHSQTNSQARRILVTILTFVVFRKPARSRNSRLKIVQLVKITPKEEERRLRVRGKGLQ
jgi:hypothetical protein